MPLSRGVLAAIALAVAIVGAAVALSSAGRSGVQPSKAALSGRASSQALVSAGHGPPAQSPVAGGSAPHSAAGSAARGGASGSTHSGPGAGAAGATSVAAGAKSGATVAEVRDPEESKSFPVPASVHHRRASLPSVAGEAAVAPGAASDAEIRKELGEEARAKAQERAARQHLLAPVAGGFSVGGNGTIPIPTDVPEVVQRVIAGGNAIADFPYIWGGGHASFVANGYDCSGSVSYALAAGGLLAAPLVSGDLAGWGEAGPGRWITIYANAGHTFMNVDGMWFDTAGRSGPYASRWLVSTPPLAGYAVRHPPGL
jgi:cell wall-associated NlpC family hydrolase